MSPKQRKKASPRVKQQLSSGSDSSSVTSPVISATTTNYREIHLNEVEALRSIYGDDFQEVETRRTAWQVGRINSIKPRSVNLICAVP